METSYGYFLIDVRAYEMEHELITADFHTPLNLHYQEYLAMLIDYLSNTKTKIDTSENEQNTLQNEIDTLTEQNTQEREYNTQLTNKNNSFLEEQSTSNLKIQDLEKDLSVKQIEIDEIRTDKNTVAKKNSEHLSMIDILQTEANGLTDKIANKDEYIEKISIERDEYKKKSEELNIEVKKLQALLEIKNNEIKIYEKTEQKYNQTLKEQKDNFNEKIRDMKQEHVNNMQDLQNRNIMQAIVKLGESKKVKVKNKGKNDK